MLHVTTPPLIASWDCKLQVTTFSPAEFCGGKSGEIPAREARRENLGVLRRNHWGNQGIRRAQRAGFPRVVTIVAVFEDI